MFNSPPTTTLSADWDWIACNLHEWRRKHRITSQKWVAFLFIHKTATQHSSRSDVGAESERNTLTSNGKVAIKISDDSFFTRSIPFSLHQTGFAGGRVFHRPQKRECFLWKCDYFNIFSDIEFYFKILDFFRLEIFNISRMLSKWMIVWTQQNCYMEISSKEFYWNIKFTW